MCMGFSPNLICVLSLLCAERDASQCNVRVCSLWLSLGVESGSFCKPVHSGSSSLLCLPRQ